MRRITLIAGLLACIVGAGNIAGAATAPQRRTPPRVVMVYKGEIVQRVRPYTFCWSYTYEDGATGMCADGWPEYPEAAEVEAGSRLRLRIRYPVKPDDWFVRAYRAVVNEDGRDETVGPPEELRFRLRPHRVDGDVRAWDVVFRVDEALRHYYLSTGGSFPQGDAFYALHAET